MDLGQFATAGGSELTKIAERGKGADGRVPDHVDFQ
jgi:hypothetical protein